MYCIRLCLTIRTVAGHTPGSICLHLTDTNGSAPGFLFTGDTLFIGACGRYSFDHARAACTGVAATPPVAVVADIPGNVLRSDLPESDPTALLRSLGRLSSLAPDTIVRNVAPFSGSLAHVFGLAFLS